MDALSLRVAARYATRPIPLDKGAIRQLADDLARKLAAYAARQPPDMELGNDHQILTWPWTAKTVNGEDIQVAGFFYSARGSSPKLITGAHIQEADLLDDGDIRLGIRLNGSLPFSAFTDGEHEGTNGLRYQINHELVHELTHVAEWWYRDRKKEPVQEEDAKGSRAREYYNSPHEVRAFMQQIIEEIMPRAAGFKRTVKPKTQQDYVTALLNISPKWKQIRGFLTPQSEKLILKAVYDALSHAGLL